MAGGYDGGMAAGRRARRRGRLLRPRRRAVWRTMSDFLSKYWLQYVALEIPDATEKLLFALSESNSRLQFLCHERNGTHEVCDLKEPVFVHAYKARAAGCPPLKAKNFLRVSVTPAFRLSSLDIIPNYVARRKGAKFGRVRPRPPQFTSNQIALRL